MRQLLETLTDGDLAAIAALDSAADTLPYATGHGTWDLASFPPAARSFIAGFFTPVQQGGGSGQLTNKIRLGWTAGNRINAQVDGVDQGSLWTDGVAPWSLAANGYQRLPNGLMMQWGSASPTSGAQSIVFPVAFTTLFNVKLTPVGGAAADTLVAQWANSKSPTGFSISTRRAVNGGLVDSIPFPCDWLALGTI